MTRLAITFALLATLASSARAGGDVGVVVTGEGSMQPQLAAQIEAWLSQHGHTLVPSPLPPEAINALVDCFVVVSQPQGCARDIFEKNAKSSTMLYARLESRSTPTGARDVTLTAYWFDKGHDAVTEQRKTCERCTDQSLRTAADDLMKKLVGGGDVGHIKLSSNPPGARITIDGQAIGVTPLDWDMPPGKHTIQMDKAGLTPASRDIIVSSNKSDAVGMVLAPIAAPPPTSTDYPSQLPTWAPIGITAVGGAAIVTGIVLIAIDQDPAFNNHKTYRDTAPLGVGVAIGGVVVGGIGTYLLLRSFKTDSAPVAAFTGDTGYIGWLGRF